jgi:hypothetical protein
MYQQLFWKSESRHKSICVCQRLPRGILKLVGEVNCLSPASRQRMGGCRRGRPSTHVICISGRYLQLSVNLYCSLRILASICLRKTALYDPPAHDGCSTGKTKKAKSKRVRLYIAARRSRGTLVESATRLDPAGQNWQLPDASCGRSDVIQTRLLAVVI